MAQSLSTFFERSKKWQTGRATGHLFFLFFLQFSFFLWIKLGLFPFFPLAFVLFSLITHISFSLFESEFPRWLLPTAVNGSTMGIQPRILTDQLATYALERQRLDLGAE